MPGASRPLKYSTHAAKKSAAPASIHGIVWNISGKASQRIVTPIVAQKSR